MGGSWRNTSVKTGSHKTVLERMLWQTTKEVVLLFFTFSILSHLFWVADIYNEPGLVLHFFSIEKRFDNNLFSKVNCLLQGW